MICVKSSATVECERRANRFHTTAHEIFFAAIACDNVCRRSNSFDLHQSRLTPAIVQGARDVCR